MQERMETPPVERNGNSSARSGAGGGSSVGETETEIPATGGLSTVAEVSTSTVTSSIIDQPLHDQTEDLSTAPVRLADM